VLDRFHRIADNWPDGERKERQQNAEDHNQIPSSSLFRNAHSITVAGLHCVGTLRWSCSTSLSGTRSALIDYDGHPHADALHTIERFRRIDLGHMEFQITIDDPKACTKTWTVKVPFDLLPDVITEPLTQSDSSKRLQRMGVGEPELT
jgi:hypothetical protein